MFVANGVARLGGWLDWVAKTLRYFVPTVPCTYGTYRLGSLSCQLDLLES